MYPTHLRSKRPTPGDPEARYYASRMGSSWWRHSNHPASGKPSAVQNIAGIDILSSPAIMRPAWHDEGGDRLTDQVAVLASRSLLKTGASGYLAS